MTGTAADPALTSLSLTLTWQHGLGCLAPFFAALAQGRLLGSRCPACGHRTVPMRALCPQDGHAMQQIDLPPAGVLVQVTTGPASALLTAGPALQSFGLVQIPGADNRLLARILSHRPPCAGDQVCQRAPREIAGAHAIAQVAPGGGKAGSAVELGCAPPIACRGHRPAPAVGDRSIADRGEQLAQRVVDETVHPLVAVVLRFDRAAPVVPRTASSERQPIVGRPLAVHDHVPPVVERRPFVQSCRLPELVGQRFGGDHQREDRRHLAVQAG